MKKIIAILLLCFGVGLGFSASVYGATWTKLNENKTSKFFIDKQSLMKKEQYQSAWVKIEYKVTQKNLEGVEKEYNLSKLLWLFDCTAQKSTTAQVFQYLDDELIYSAAIDYKLAEFIEPVPETEVDIAMRSVCKAAKLSSNAVSKTSASVVPQPNGALTKTSAAETKAGATATIPVAAIKTDAKQASQALPVKATEAATDKAIVKTEAKIDVVNPAVDKTLKSKTDSKHKVSDKEAYKWSYEGKEGPENWSKLSADYAACEFGRNQSPINIDSTLHASLMPFRTSQKFPAKDIVNNGRMLQVNFTMGNVLVLDSALFQMKHMVFHTPSENKIHGKAYPLEAQFMHADAKGNLAVIAVMFEEGLENPSLASILLKIPKERGDVVTLKTRILPSELMSANHGYYRFSGSLTTPPCSEGVRWLVMKAPMTVSKSQITVFKSAIGKSNNRPLQPLNGRLVVE